MKQPKPVLLYLLLLPLLIRSQPPDNQMVADDAKENLVRYFPNSYQNSSYNPKVNSIHDGTVDLDDEAVKRVATAAGKLRKSLLGSFLGNLQGLVNPFGLLTSKESANGNHFDLDKFSRAEPAAEPRLLEQPKVATPPKRPLYSKIIDKITGIFGKNAKNQATQESKRDPADRMMEINGNLTRKLTKSKMASISTPTPTTSPIPSTVQPSTLRPNSLVNKFVTKISSFWKSKPQPKSTENTTAPPSSNPLFNFFYFISNRAPKNNPKLPQMAQNVSTSPRREAQPELLLNNQNILAKFSNNSTRIELSLHLLSLTFSWLLFHLIIW